ILLGIHPGFGGTVRSIKLVGPLAAMKLMLTGRTLGASQARKISLVDYTVPERHLDNALQILLTAPPAPRSLPLPERLAGLPLARSVVAHFLRRSVMHKAD